MFLLTLQKAVVGLSSSDFSPGLSFVAISISHVNFLGGLAFKSAFPHSRLHKPTLTESMQMLATDLLCRNELGFTLNTYGMDMEEYVFNE